MKKKMQKAYAYDIEKKLIFDFSEFSTDVYGKGADVPSSMKFHFYFMERMLTLRVWNSIQLMSK